MHDLRAALTHSGTQSVAPVGTSRSCQEGIPARVGSLHRAAWKSLSARLFFFLWHISTGITWVPDFQQNGQCPHAALC